MILKLRDVDLERCTITFTVPEETFKKLAFAPCKLDVDLIPLMDFYTLRQTKIEATK